MENWFHDNFHGSPTTTELGSPTTIDESVGFEELGTMDESGSPATIDESGSPTTIDESGSPITMDESRSIHFKRLLAYIDKESVSTDFENHNNLSTSAALFGKKISADIPK